MKNQRKLCEHLLVGEAYGSQPALVENVISLLVGIDLLLVDRAIHFDDQGGLVTVKVDNEAVDHLLAAKVPTRQLPAAQFPPQNSFRLGHLPPKLMRTNYLLIGDLLTNDNISR